MDTVALNCLVFEKIAFFAFWRQTDKQTDEQMDTTDALSGSRCRERQLNKSVICLSISVCVPTKAQTAKRAARTDVLIYRKKIVRRPELLFKPPLATARAA